MQLLIVILLAVIAIAVAPWIIGVFAIAVGTYAVAVAVLAGLALALLIAAMAWQGASLLRARARDKKAAEKSRIDLQQIMDDHAISARHARKRAEDRGKEATLEAERNEASRVGRLVPCPHCLSKIAKGSLYCPACGKQPISTRPVVRT